MTPLRREDLRIDIVSETGAWEGIRDVTDEDLAQLGYVKVTDEWLFCPGCGRPRIDGPNPGPYCLPTNCDMWEELE